MEMKKNEHQKYRMTKIPISKKRENSNRYKFFDFFQKQLDMGILGTYILQ